MQNGRVLVADGDATFRSWLAGLLRRAELETIEVAEGLSALEAVRRDRPALAVVDVSLRGVSGYEVCRVLRDRYGDGIPIVFVSADRTDPMDRVAGLLIGADDYLAKPVDGDELLARVRRLLARAQANGGNGSRPTQSYSLTTRELEVLQLLSKGRPPGEIARELVISPKTVSSHIQRILVKLGVHSRVQAVARAYESGLIDQRDFHLHGDVTRTAR